jgi:hypothetical protein
MERGVRIRYDSQLCVSDVNESLQSTHQANATAVRHSQTQSACRMSYDTGTVAGLLPTSC